MCALHAEIRASAADPALFVMESRDFFARHLDDDGRILGLFDEADALVGYSVLGLPRAEDPANFGADLGLPLAERAVVAHFDGTGIHPDWQGRGLQRRLIVRRLKMAWAEGRRIALSTAAPGNRWSLANLLAERFRVVALVAKYDSVRFVLRRDRDRPVAASAWPIGAAVPLGEEARHRRLLAAGWTGVALSADGAGGYRIDYAPPAAAAAEPEHRDMPGS